MSKKSEYAHSTTTTVGLDYAKRKAAILERKRKRLIRALEAYREIGTMEGACKAAGISKIVVYDMLKKYPKFRAAWEDAKESFVDGLEEAGIKRAKERSDLLLMFFLKAHRPHLYRENQTPKAATQVTYEQHITIASQLAQQIQSGAVNVVLPQRRDVGPLGTYDTIDVEALSIDLDAKHALAIKANNNTRASDTDTDSCDTDIRESTNL